MTKKEHYQIIFSSIIITVAISLIYAYFIGFPLSQASHSMAYLFCQALGISCQP